MDHTAKILYGVVTSQSHSPQISLEHDVNTPPHRQGGQGSRGMPRLFQGTKLVSKKDYYCFINQQFALEMKENSEA